MPTPAAFVSPADLPDADLEAAITTLSANINAATWQLLSYIAELDRREVWGGWGVKSCAHWLNWQCGIAMGAAREKVRVARTLEATPQISAAFAAGELSYSKVRAMTRIANAENEDYLLMIARHGTATHVEQLVRAYRAADRADATQRATLAQQKRTCQWHYAEDGTFVLHARLPAEVGALFVEALAAAAEHVPAGTPAPEEAPPDEPYAARRADALALLAERFLTGDGDTAARSADRHTVVIHVDRDALRETGEYQRCDLDHGPALAPETARRLACDASTVELDEDAGEPLNIGRKSRTIPPALRRFLANRDRGCRFPGCTERRHVDAHHVRHWADGGETRADNLILLCRHHHRLVHEDGYTVERRDDGRWLLFTPTGVLIPHAPETPRAEAPIDEVNAARGVDVPAGTGITRWAGERMDLGMAVDGLSQAEVRRDRRGADLRAMV